MKLRAPAYPLVTVDPYFSLWSMGDTLNGDTVRQWSGITNTAYGIVTIDGTEKVFMGLPGERAAIPQISVDFDALSTYYVFADEKIRLNVRFTSPLLPDDLKRMTRPVSYLTLSYESLDGQAHTVSVSVSVSEEICTDKKDDTFTCTVTEAGGIPAVRIGRDTQKPLNRSGDFIGIEWGYFYLAVPEGEVSHFLCEKENMKFVCGKKALLEKENALFLLAYDDIVSLDYFGTHVKSLWNADGTTIEEAIAAAYADYPERIAACDEFSDKMYLDGAKAGGCHYAELLSIAYRQVIAAHKCALDPDGNIILLSKECGSGGYTGTVDVSYPACPIFLYYNPELVRALMRPIYRYLQSGEWKWEFSPHDSGQYPLIHGPVYTGGNTADQMPVEECANMLIMEAAAAQASGGDVSFAREHWDVLSGWAHYIEVHGTDPENQLCTDDFAGHLVHNCNLAMKAIMGVAAFGILNRFAGRDEDYRYYLAEAKEMARSWAERASNGDGSYKLAFDRPGTYSMKYNGVWDKLFGTEIFPAEVFTSELTSNFRRFNTYGMPLDNRADYTKSDWISWTATMLSDDDDFERFIEPMWQAYHHTNSRVPLTDWYDTVTADQTTTDGQYGFRNRTVQGAFFIKLLDKSGKMKL